MMSNPTPGHVPGCCGVTRRGLLLGGGLGLLAGGAAGWWGALGWQALREGSPSRFTGRSVEVPRADFAMPGPFPGRVIQVRNPAAVSPTHVINRAVVRQMLDRGMCELVGADNPLDGWRRFFQRGDRIGIKVNPVGRARNGSIASISSPEVVLEIVAKLKAIGIPPRDILLYERYATEFRDTGYDKLLRERDMDGVRWCAASADYDNAQLEIDGQLRDRDRDPHAVGYDPDVFVSMGFAAPEHSPRDDRRFRSHLSTVVTRMVDKIITIPCLKDHRSAGVTLALKNMSHGMNNNVARSHIGRQYRLDGSTSGPNQCNTFIPTAVAQRPLREKATLHVMDGLIAVYEGGPGSWNRTWGTWRRQSLFIATDPVAMDHVGWDIIDAKRALEGWRPVGHMGQANAGRGVTLGPRLAALAALGTPEAGLLAVREFQAIPNVGEDFDRRQPEHIVLAGLLGLGTFDARQIDHRCVEGWPAARRERET